MNTQLRLIMISLANIAISWILLAAIFTITRNTAFVDALIAPYTVLIALSAGVCSYLGLYRKQINTDHGIN